MRELTHFLDNTQQQQSLRTRDTHNNNIQLRQAILLDIFSFPSFSSPRTPLSLLPFLVATTFFYLETYIHVCSQSSRCVAYAPGRASPPLSLLADGALARPGLCRQDLLQRQKKQQQHLLISAAFVRKARLVAVFVGQILDSKLARCSIQQSSVGAEIHLAAGPVSEESGSECIYQVKGQRCINSQTDTGGMSVCFRCRTKYLHSLDSQSSSCRTTD